MEDYLIHYGVLGMKWGVRRYQNEDGTLTEAGKKRYSTPERFGNDLKIAAGVSIGAILAGPIGAILGGAVTLTTLFIKEQNAIKKGRSVVEKASTTPVAMLTQEEAERLGYGESTRLSPEEESEFWKAYAKRFES